MKELFRNSRRIYIKELYGKKIENSFNRQVTRVFLFDKEKCQPD